MPMKGMQRKGAKMLIRKGFYISSKNFSAN